MNRIRRFLFPQRNRIFTALTGLLLLMIFLVIKYCDAPLLLPEKWFGFILCNPDGDKTWYNIAISYVAAYIFYIIQVYIPSTNAEKQAWLNIQPRLSACVREWKEYTILLRTLLVFEENDNVLPTEKAFRYYRICEDDNRPSGAKKIAPKGKPQRTPDSCYGTDGLIKKAKEMGERSQKLMDLQAMGKLDVNLWGLLCDINPVSFFQGAVRDLDVIKRIFDFRQTLSEAQAEERKNKILQEFVLPDGITVKREGNKIFLQAWDGTRQEIPFANCKEMSIFTPLPESLRKMEIYLGKLDRYCKLNSRITIAEMTDEERAQVDANNAIYHPTIAKAMKMS